MAEPAALDDIPPIPGAPQPPARSDDHASALASDLALCARRAPHPPGPRPWTLRTARPGVLVLRVLPGVVAGPPLRRGTLAGGAALFHLRVAARSAGCDPEVSLLPEPDDQRLLAAVSLDGACDAPESVTRLRAAVDLPAASPPAEVSASLLAGLEEDAALEGAWLHLVGDRVHDPAIGGGAAVRPGPLVAVIGTAGDDAIDWLAAGQAFARLRLRARAMGVPVWSSFGTVTGAGSHRPALAVPGRSGVPQLLLQIGDAAG